MKKQKIKILLYGIVFLCMGLNSSQAQPIKCLPSEVYRPESLHTPVINFRAYGTKLPFLGGDTIQNVQIVNDTVIYGGDIVLGRYDSVISPTSIYKKNDTTFLWNCNSIPYEITGFSGKDLLRIKQAIKYVNRKTHLYWRPKNITDDCYVKFVKKKKSYNSPLGCLCKGNNKPHIINLDTIPAFGKIVHEISHTMGLYHEQERHDKPSSVVINTANIMPAYKSNFVQQNHQPTYLENLPTTLQIYDYESIMHYNQYAFSLIPPIINPSGTATSISTSALPTITTSHSIGQRKQYTASDTAKINALYPNGIEKVGLNQYKMVYVVNGNTTNNTTPIQYGLVSNLNGSVSTTTTTNTIFTITPSCSTPILKVVVGGCEFYEDLY